MSHCGCSQLHFTNKQNMRVIFILSSSVSQHSTTFISAICGHWDGKPHVCCSPHVPSDRGVSRNGDRFSLRITVWRCWITGASMFSGSCCRVNLLITTSEKLHPPSSKPRFLEEQQGSGLRAFLHLPSSPGERPELARGVNSTLDESSSSRPVAGPCC